MQLLRYLRVALWNNLCANLANPFELFTGAVSMIVNNLLYFGAVSLALFSGGGSNSAVYFKYYVCLQSMLYVSWGSVTFFCGGLRELPNFVESGELDVYLAQPKPVLLLAGLSRSIVFNFGDLVQGIAMWVIVGIFYGPHTLVSVVCATALSILGCVSLFVLMGAASLLIPRGSSLGDLILSAVLIPAGWPIGPKLLSWERMLLNFTPLGFLILLPMDLVTTHEVVGWISSAFGVVLGFLCSVFLFKLGLKRYKGNSFFQVK